MYEVVETFEGSWSTREEREKSVINTALWLAKTRWGQMWGKSQLGSDWPRLREWCVLASAELYHWMMSLSTDVIVLNYQLLATVCFLNLRLSTDKCRLKVWYYFLWPCKNMAKTNRSTVSANWTQSLVSCLMIVVQCRCWLVSVSSGMWPAAVGEERPRTGAGETLERQCQDIMNHINGNIDAVSQVRDAVINTWVIIIINDDSDTPQTYVYTFVSRDNGRWSSLYQLHISIIFTIILYIYIISSKTITGNCRWLRQMINHETSDFSEETSCCVFFISLWKWPKLRDLNILPVKYFR